MLRIRPEIVAAVTAASSAEDLLEHLQAAIELEHATIPPYLTALFSIKTGANGLASDIVASVVAQEMLHMTIAANLLNALGGAPRIDRAGFLPVYPGPLPMGVAGGLTVGLAKLTRALVYDVFMRIEEPEAAIPVPVKAPRAAMLAAVSRPAPDFATIGQFYRAIADKITELGPPAFTGDPARQVVDTTWFPVDQLFPIAGVDSALAAIDVIVRQGEGTASNPEDGGEPAHYYRFAQLVYARMLEPDPAESAGWSFSGPIVGIEPAGVWNLLPDAKVADYAPNSRAQILGDQVNRTYTNLLRSLQATFDGDPVRLKAALGLMFELNIVASELVTVPLAGTGYYAAPTFEYQPV
jgi:hypothetical protein